MSEGYSVRRLTTQSEFAACAALQRAIWGIPEADSMSSITMQALAMEYPRIGLSLGAFSGEEMVGLGIVFAAFEAHTAYGHMLGIKREYRDTAIGVRLQQETLNLLKQDGIRYFCLTFDPLESRNAHLYLNRQGAVGIKFKPNAYGVSGTMHGGLPMDRLVTRVDLTAPPPPPPPKLEEAFQAFPVATPEQMPEVEAMMVEIPADIGYLREHDHAAALAASQSARAVFTEYINKRGMVSCALVRGELDGRPRSFHLLKSLR